MLHASLNYAIGAKSDSNRVESNLVRTFSNFPLILLSCEETSGIYNPTPIVIFVNGLHNCLFQLGAENRAYATKR